MQSPRDIFTRTVLPSLTFVMLLSKVLRMQIRGLLDSKMAISDDLVTLSNSKELLTKAFPYLTFFTSKSMKLTLFSNLGFIGHGFGDSEHVFFNLFFIFNICCSIFKCGFLRSGILGFGKLCVSVSYEI